MDFFSRRGLSLRAVIRSFLVALLLVLSLRFVLERVSTKLDEQDSPSAGVFVAGAAEKGADDSGSGRGSVVKAGMPLRSTGPLPVQEEAPLVLVPIGVDTWIGNSANSNLSTAGNWSGTNTPPLSGDALTFGAAGTSGLNLNNNLTSAAFNIAGMTFNAGAGAFVMGNGTTTANAGNAFTLTGDVTNNSTSVQTINNPFNLSGMRTFTTTAGGGDITLGGVISGTDGLTVAGGGIVTLTATNTYTGDTIINLGATLRLGDGTGSPNGTGSIKKNVLNSGTLIFDRPADYFFDGVISGSGRVTLNAGVVRLRAAQTYTGPTQIDSIAALVLGVDFALSASTVVNVDFVGPNRGALDLAGHQLKIGGLTGAGRVYSFGASAGSLEVFVVAGQVYNFSGLLGAVDTNFSFTKSGPGTQILSGTTTYIGTTTIGGGTLQLSSNASLSSASTVTVLNPGSTLAVNYGGASDYTEAQVAALLARTTFSASTTLFAFDTTNASGPATYGNALTMNARLTKLGAGTLVLTGNNTYTGATLITAGTLQVGNGGAAGALPSGTAVTDNGTLVFNLSGPVAQSGITGSGDVVQQGSGTLTLSGTNTYTGATLISAGTLQVGNGGTTGSLSPSSAITINGTLAFNRSDLVTQGIDFASFLTGSGQLVQQGSGTLWLLGTNTLGGGAVVNSGTIKIGDGINATVQKGGVGLGGADGALTTNIAFGPEHFGGAGGAGGNAIFVNNGGMLDLSPQTSIVAGVGGHGGRGGAASIANGAFYIPGDGGAGGPGGNAIVINGGTLSSLPLPATVTGGVGGDGGEEGYGQDGALTLFATGGSGGAGGTAVLFMTASSWISSGTIAGGVGGVGGKGDGQTSGTGGSGVAFSQSGSLLNHGTITGGNGGHAPQVSLIVAQGMAGMPGGNGGAGVIFGAGGSLTNSGVIGGGRGGAGADVDAGSSFPVNGGAGGNGGTAVVFSAGGSLSNSGTISGGLGGVGGGTISGGVPGADGSTGYGVMFSGSAGTLTNQSGGIINGGVVMGNFANNVTLETGSTINGLLNLGTSPSATLTLTGSGSQVYSAAVTGVTTFSGSLTKNGTGTWTLDQTWNYTGATGAVVNSGTLKIGDGINAATQKGGAGLGGADGADTFGTDFGPENYGGAGGAGGNVIVVNNGGTLDLSTQTSIVAGNGGNGGMGGSVTNNLVNNPSNFPANGGAAGPGGNAIVINGGTLSNLPSQATVIGGAGGTGGEGGTGVVREPNHYTYTKGVAGASGVGGTAILFMSASSWTTSGTITGGAGGVGGPGFSGSSGVGGSGIAFSQGGFLVNHGTITGGVGGLSAVAVGGQVAAVIRSGGNGGSGVTFAAGGLLTNSGAISGGRGSAGGAIDADAPFLINGGAGGNGGAAVIFSLGGSLSNSGTINGGLGGLGATGAGGGVPGADGSTGYGVIFSGSAGTLSNQSGGIINGGVVMDNFANNVTLETGSTINGLLNLGTSPSATLTLTGSGSQVYSAAVTGVTTFSGSLTKNGSGTWTLDQAFTSTQATTVNGGTLIVSGSIAGSTTAVSGAGSTLGGTGTVAAVNVGSGALLEGGDGSSASGALTSGGNVSLASGAYIELTLGLGATHSSLARTGGTWSFDLNQRFVFNLAPGAVPGTYDNLITGLAGNEAGLAGIGNWTIATPGVIGTFSYDGAGDVDLTLIAVPEPATAALFAAGLPLLGLRRRRRRR